VTASERRIWEAAYAAAYIREFYDELNLRHATRQGGYDDVSDPVERSMDVADKTIASLRRWIKQEGPGDSEYLKETTSSGR
jgi:ribosomal protein L17